MSDCMIIRRGGGGQGFDPNGAVLKVITSTGCTVLVTGTGYSKTHQQADGFPRSNNADVTEHFFSIPASAFGTITVKATNTYGDNTKTLTVNTAGKVYELLCAGLNIILNSTFGLQSGWNMYRTEGYGSVSYNQYDRVFTLNSGSNATAIALYHGNDGKIDFTPYDNIKLKYTFSGQPQSSSAYLKGADGFSYSAMPVYTTSVATPLTLTPPDMLKNPYGVEIFLTSGSGKHMYISEIVLS